MSVYKHMFLYMHLHTNSVVNKVKHNLKTIKHALHGDRPFNIVLWDNLKDEIEAFEKELREKLKSYQDEGSIGGDIIAQEYKEILGEENE